MADIATVWHWPPSEMNPMELEELIYWHELATERAPQEG